MVITSGPVHSQTVVDIWKRRGSALTSSFEEEKEAMAMAVQWIIFSEPEGRILICLDSQSLLKAIANESEDTYEVRAELLQVKGDVVIQWVPGHMDIPGNEAADKVAKEAACITDDPLWPVSLASALIDCTGLQEDQPESGSGRSQVMQVCHFPGPDLERSLPELKGISASTT